MGSIRSVVLFAGLPLAFALAACGDDGPAGKTIEPPHEPTGTAPAINNPPAAAEPPAVCNNAEGVFEATKEPSDVLILLDRSGSMQIKLSNNETRWTATKRGLFDLLANLPATTTAGAMMFPQGDPPVDFCFINASNAVECTPGPARPPKAPRCTPNTYKLGVPNASLDQAQVDKVQAYVAASDTEFYYGTPMHAALAAAIDAQRNSGLPGAKSVVLLTDGNPTDCHTDADPDANNISHVVEAAADGAAGSTLVRTFVMGVIDGDKGATPENLSKVAKAGATGRTANCEATNECFYALNASTFQQDIKQAFAEISLQAFDCTFNLPAGNALTDPSKTNVEIETPNGKHAISKDTNHQNGWDYLPNGTQIQLYGQACQDMKSQEKAKVNIVIGCKTVETPAPAQPN
jgi:hypothetical protein